MQAEQRVYAKINQYDLQDGMLERVLVSRRHNATETERKGCQIRHKNASRIQQNQKESAVPRYDAYDFVFYLSSLP